MSSSAACQRKPTRPSVILPERRPVSNEVAATGSRRLPEPALLVTSNELAATEPRSILEPTPLVTSNEFATTEPRSLPEPVPPVSRKETTTRKTFEDLGLILSDDDDDTRIPFPTQTTLDVVKATTSADDVVGGIIKKRQAILIEPQLGSRLCKYQFAKGGKKGTLCGAKCSKGRDKCSVHASTIPKKNSTTNNDPAVLDKIAQLEKIVLNMMKNKSPETPQPNLNALQQESAFKTVTDSLNKLQNQIANLEQSAEKVLKKKTIKSQSLQKIRIHKLDPFETYFLIRYRDGYAVFQIKSTGRQIMVPLPNRMARPIPNGKWCLVCHDQLPKMIWKEV